MKKVLLFLFVCLLFVGVQAEDGDMYSGKVHNKEIKGVERTFTGSIVCIGCDLKKSGSRSECAHFGHQYRFKTNAGLYLTILKNKYSETLLKMNLPSDKEFTMTGIHFANATAVDLHSYQIDEKQFSWCEIHTVMDGCAAQK